MSVRVAEETKVASNLYLNELLKLSRSQPSLCDSQSSGWIEELRHQAAIVVENSRMPVRKDEEWKFTDLSELLQLQLHLPRETEPSKDTLTEFLLPETTRTLVVFVNGIYQPQLSDLSGLKTRGVWAGNLTQLPTSFYSQIQQYLGRQEGANEVFTALNTSGLKDVAVIWANSNAIAEQPIHLLYLTQTTQDSILSQPRTLIVAEPGSSLQVVEQYGVITKEDHRSYLTNAVTEIWVRENAALNHTRLQREAGVGFHIGKTAISQHQNSSYTCNEIGFGAKLYRHDLQVRQLGAQTETKLNGLMVIGGEQLADTHSSISLTQPHGIVSQLHKCIVGDRARAVFNGKICVPKAAQLTNATQLNRNLLLSPKARVNTKPELQITADNVKCAHGATASQLEADEIFYLRSRGLSDTDARNLLIDAFAAEIIDRIPLASLRTRLTQCIACKTIH